jgi:chitinase
MSLLKRDPGKSRSRRRVSLVRLVAVLSIVAGVVIGSAWLARAAVETFEAGESVRFSPYVDVTLTPFNHFEDPLENRASEVVLSFVVADNNDPCQPSWGTYYSLDAAGRALDLDRRIARYRERGGDITVSFGGQANDALAVACSDVDALTEAYETVIDRYDLAAIDIDIEGEALVDDAATRRRAEALAQIQRERDDPIEVWLTLPVLPSGLTPEGIAVVETSLDSGVELAGVNIMTMNFGGSRSNGSSMGEASVDALRSTQRQLHGMLQRRGELIGLESVWPRIGATPMIGQNDIAGDRFDLEDAHHVADFAAKVGLGRVSLWSINRDGPCSAQLENDQVSNSCSGVDQEPQAFSSVFLEQSTVASTEGRETTQRSAVTRDDPETSPYPIWRSTRGYEGGDKIVWHGGVYEAKWWSESDIPDAPIEQLWDTPWRYLGPVLESDTVVIEATRAQIDGSWPEWSADDVYQAGEEVVHRDMVFRAGWWTQGDEPDDDPDRAFDHPWEYLGDVDLDDEENGKV